MIRNALQAIKRLACVATLLVTMAALSIVAVSPSQTGEVADKHMSNEYYKALMTKAEFLGVVPIIVRLRMAFVPEGKLPNLQAIQRQRNAVSELRDRVLKRLASYHVSSIKRYNTN